MPAAVLSCAPPLGLTSRLSQSSGLSPRHLTYLREPWPQDYLAPPHFPLASAEVTLPFI